MREASLAAVEQDVFLGAYAIRKLIESQKISDEVESMTLRAAAFAPRGKPVDVMNWFKLDRVYDLDRSAAVDVSLRDWCNQVVHSFVFVVDAELTGLTGFFIASDRAKDTRLLHFAIDVVVDAMQRVADDVIAHAHWQRDDAGVARLVSKSNQER